MMTSVQVASAPAPDTRNPPPVEPVALKIVRPVMVTQE
jgi:hypothetical protein